MAKSSEFPQYDFRPPKSFTGGRKAGQPTVIFIHTTEGSEGPSSAEDGADYDARRPDGTSTHFFVDQNSTIQCVHTWNEAHAARAHGNDVGIQIEVCGRAGQTAAQWQDAASAGAIEQAARLCLAIRAKYGKARFPLVNITPAQLRSGANGFAEHLDATLAWPEDGGTHSDPGPNFPWTQLFARIQELEKGPTDVPLADDMITVSASAQELFPNASVGDKKSAAEFLALSAIWSRRAAAYASGAGAGIATLLARDNVDEAEVARHLAPLLAPFLTGPVDLETLVAALRQVLGGLDQQS